MVALKLSALLAFSALYSSVVAISAQYRLRDGEGVAWFQTLSISRDMSGQTSFTQCRTACANAPDKCIGFTWNDTGDVCRFLGLAGVYGTRSTGASGPLRYAFRFEETPRDCEFGDNYISPSGQCVACDAGQRTATDGKSCVLQASGASRLRMRRMHMHGRRAPMPIEDNTPW